MFTIFICTNILIASKVHDFIYLDFDVLDGIRYITE
jgi:hypothetical protein